jgi:transcriptional regulator with XRE-family HTH domain
MTTSDAGFARELGLRLAALRRRTGLTQRELAERMGLSPAGGRVHLARLEKGRYRDPGLPLLIRYLHACDRSVAGFMNQMARDGLLGRAEALAAQSQSIPGSLDETVNSIRACRSARQRRNRQEKRMLHDAITPLVQSYCVGRHLVKLNAYWGVGEMFRRSAKLALLRRPGPDRSALIRTEFDRIETRVTTGPAGLVPEAVRKVRRLVEQELRGSGPASPPDRGAGANRPAD